MGQIIAFPCPRPDPGEVPCEELVELLDTMADDVEDLLRSLLRSIAAIGSSGAFASARTELLLLTDQVRELSEAIDGLRARLAGCDIPTIVAALVELVFRTDRLEMAVARSILGVVEPMPAPKGAC